MEEFYKATYTALTFGSFRISQASSWRREPTPTLFPRPSKLVYHIRGETAKDLDDLVPRVEACFAAAAQASGCTMRTEKGQQYKELIHNVALTKTFRKHGHALGKWSTASFILAFFAVAQ
ncbi:hypothetical protein HPB48_007839 [Haemaphysalis longicornis]|uniref:Uncharacterized protein n=1 Tax=Haemaphysalis longicornis TaxID=44386 RepID=A0A9J6GAH7_HAELO|nr:hypothetical protein HPB48_007839 [Haemaphysalis longicornis]